uniref:Signal recognition particle receptor subunit alpha n=1 Tax=Albugo laibachii Nc14 TaxID=890382 RepID=F0WLX1_9STRA|nr:signal recognition particle receptor subunit alpha [Albugo laibachii Nc14]|eukprot:CCA22298.1 signal recognition particle receptor subunit alpha [Albugo laibachii Nc14]
MIDHFIVFSKSGLVLWSQTICKLNNDPIQALIQQVLLQDRSGDKKFFFDSYCMQWTFENKLELVFVVVYQKILQLMYIEELLERVKKDFVTQFRMEIMGQVPVKFDRQFSIMMKETESKYTQKMARKGPRTFESSRKSTNSSGRKIHKKKDLSQESTADKEAEADDADSFGAPQESGRLGVKQMRTGRGRKGSKKKPTEKKENQNSWKKMTKWEDGKLSKKEISQLDHSVQASAAEEEAQLCEIRKAYIGSDSDSENDDLTSGASSSDAEDSEKEGSWSFGNSKVRNFLSSITGNKILTKEDLEPALNQMRQILIGKNVASEVADELCDSVESNVVGKRLESFTRVSSVVRGALEAALLRILTPKKSTDILRAILDVRASGRAYSIVFVGVNGVGKSTSLSKICYYLKSKGVKVMIAACDTFRSGAVEQLNQHAKVLDVPLFERGYAKNPAAVAQEAIQHATTNSFDCVLIDTAGRMQNNEPLMRALAKLVSSNNPDLILFVGEALVGNDGINQLSMFDRALADSSDRQDAHGIDGIVITKFDTIDDKVGAAVSLVYKTGQPIMFVGTGQKYTHLKKLNVQTVMRNLLA